MQPRQGDPIEVVYSYYAEKQHDTWRNLGSWLTNRVADLLLDKPRGLYLCSFRIITRFVAQEVCRYDGPFAYVDGLILQVTQNIGRIEVEHAPRASGESGYTIGKLLHLWMSMFINFSVVPLRLATFVGFGMAGIGFVYLLAVIVEGLRGSPMAGWSSIMAALLVFCGAQLVLLGIAGEYIGRIFLTANKRPQFVIKDVVRNEAPAEMN